MLSRRQLLALLTANANPLDTCLNNHAPPGFVDPSLTNTCAPTSGATICDYDVNSSAITCTPEAVCDSALDDFGVAATLVEFAPGTVSLYGACQSGGLPVVFCCNWDGNGSMKSATLNGSIGPDKLAFIDEPNNKYLRPVGAAPTLDALIVGGQSNDSIFGSRHAVDYRETLLGGSGADGIQGNAGPDLIRGGADADDVDAGKGDDTVFGDAGEDTIRGGDGNDSLFGGPNTDIIEGGPGSDLIRGQRDADFLYGDFESDPNGGPFFNVDDTIYGGRGNDIIYGGRGNDLLLGELHDDTIYGGPGADRIHGSKGNDELRGGQHDDVIYSGLGNDNMYGGANDDIMCAVSNGVNGNCADFKGFYGEGGLNDLAYQGWGIGGTQELPWCPTVDFHGNSSVEVAGNPANPWDWDPVLATTGATTYMAQPSQCSDLVGIGGSF